MRTGFPGAIFPRRVWSNWFLLRVRAMRLPVVIRAFRYCPRWGLDDGLLVSIVSCMQTRSKPEDTGEVEMLTAPTDTCGPSHCVGIAQPEDCRAKVRRGNKTPRISPPGLVDFPELTWFKCKKKESMGGGKSIGRRKSGVQQAFWRAWVRAVSSSHHIIAGKRRPTTNRIPGNR